MTDEGKKNSEGEQDEDMMKSLTRKEEQKRGTHDGEVPSRFRLGEENSL